MTRSVIVTLYVVGSLFLAPLGAVAQSRGLEMRSPDHLGSQTARQRLPGRELHPSRPAVPDAPGFIAPFSKQTETGRAGIAGWTTPDMPVGSRGAADPNNPGWLGFGFATQWGGPAGRAQH